MHIFKNFIKTSVKFTSYVVLSWKSTQFLSKTSYALYSFEDTKRKSWSDVTSFLIETPNKSLQSSYQLFSSKILQAFKSIFNLKNVCYITYKTTPFVFTKTHPFSNLSETKNWSKKLNSTKPNSFLWRHHSSGLSSSEYLKLCNQLCYNLSFCLHVNYLMNKSNWLFGNFSNPETCCVSFYCFHQNRKL